MDGIVFSTAEILEELSRLRVCAIRDDDWLDVHLTSLKLTHLGESDLLVLWRGVKHNENGGHTWVNLKIVEEVVSDGRDWEALAVQVGQLLHLKAAFLSYSLGKSLSEEHDTLSSLEDFSCTLGERDTALECQFHVARQVSQLIDIPGSDTLRLVVAFPLREPESDESKHNHLRDVCFG